MGKMKSKQEAVKWDREDFLKSFFVKKGDQHADWASFYGAMNDGCMAATGSALDENVLSMRCGAAKAYYSKSGGSEWSYPARPKKTPEKPPTIAELMAKIEAGEIVVEVTAE